MNLNDELETDQKFSVRVQVLNDGDKVYSFTTREFYASYTSLSSRLDSFCIDISRAFYQAFSNSDEVLINAITGEKIKNHSFDYNLLLLNEGIPFIKIPFSSVPFDHVGDLFDEFGAMVKIIHDKVIDQSIDIEQDGLIETDQFKLIKTHEVKDLD